MSGRGNPSSDRQVSDLRPPMTTNESAPDPTAAEGKVYLHPDDGHTLDCTALVSGAWRCSTECPERDTHPGDAKSMRRCTCDALNNPCDVHDTANDPHWNSTPDADDASEPLTEAEVDTLADAFVAANRAEFMDTDFDLPIQQAVERIKAAAATKARADERERIAQAIEAEASKSSYRDPYAATEAYLDAARIAGDGDA